MKQTDPSSLLPNLPRGSRVLILRLRSLGDTVLLTPALAALHAWRPDLRISVLVEPAFADVLEGNPAVAEILLLRRSLAAVWAMRRRRFAAAYNQHAGPRSAILTAASGAPLRVAWAGRQFSFVYNVQVPGGDAFYAQEPHTAEYAMTQFYWTGLPRGEVPAARVYPQPDALAAIERKLAERGIAAGQPYVVLRPGASAADKRWPVEHFAWLVRRLRDEQGLAPVVNLGPGDGEIAAATRATLGAECALLNGLGVRELIALIARGRIFVGNDSGPTHIAAALERPTVVLFGASNAAHWAPWKTPQRLLRRSTSPDDAAGDASGKTDIAAITREEVLAACASLLDETRLAAAQGPGPSR